MLTRAAVLPFTRQSMALRTVAPTAGNQCPEFNLANVIWDGRAGTGGTGEGSRAYSPSSAGPSPPPAPHHTPLQTPRTSPANQLEVPGHSLPHISLSSHTATGLFTHTNSRKLSLCAIVAWNFFSILLSILETVQFSK